MDFKRRIVDSAPALAVFFSSLALYLSTLAPGMLRGDSGEFQWAMASLNVAHATGYPLYTLIGHAWLQLPFPGAAAWRLNLLSAFFGAASVAAVFTLARTVTRRTDAALLAAAFFALAPVFWFNASILEVYTLHALFTAAILVLVLMWGQAAPDERNPGLLYAAFFLLGLSLAHHRMTILLAPGIAAYLWLVDRRFFRDLRRLLILGLLLLPGLALYLYVPWRLLATGQTLSYAFFDIILGRQFASSLRLYPQPLYVLIQVPFQNFHFGLLLAVPGAYSLFKRSRNAAVLLLLVLLSDLLFALFYTVPDVEVFLIPSFVVIAVWIAEGAARLIEFASSRLLACNAAWAPALVVLLAIPLGLISANGYPAIRAQVAAEEGGKEERARALLAANLPPNSFLELDWETATAVRFLQSVEGTRQDLDARLIHVNNRDEFLLMLKKVDEGRPVYVESGVKWTRTIAGYRTAAAPVDLVRVLPDAARPEPIDVAISDRVELTGLQNSRDRFTLIWKTTGAVDVDLATFIHYYDSSGKPLGQEDHAPCCQAIYGYRTTEWEPGREIADVFRPLPPGTRSVEIGMYSMHGDQIQGYGETRRLEIDAPPQH